MMSMISCLEKSGISVMEIMESFGDFYFSNTDFIFNF